MLSLRMGNSIILQFHATIIVLTGVYLTVFYSDSSNLKLSTSMQRALDGLVPISTDSDALHGLSAKFEHESYTH